MYSFCYQWHQSCFQALLWLGNKTWTDYTISVLVSLPALGNTRVMIFVLWPLPAVGSGISERYTWTVQLFLRQDCETLEPWWNGLCGDTVSLSWYTTWLWTWLLLRFFVCHQISNTKNSGWSIVKRLYPLLLSPLFSSFPPSPPPLQLHSPLPLLLPSPPSLFNSSPFLPPILFFLPRPSPQPCAFPSGLSLQIWPPGQCLFHWLSQSGAPSDSWHERPHCEDVEGGGGVTASLPWT